MSVTLNLEIPSSLVKWHGGKIRQIKKIGERFPDFKNVETYIEPFVGAGSVFLLAYQLAPSNTHFILSDNNASLINCYKQVRDNCSQVCEVIQELQHDDYYQIRSQFNENLNEESPLQAGRMIWLITSCFGGGWRCNKKGHFNFSQGWSFNKESTIQRLQRLHGILVDDRIEITHSCFHKQLLEQSFDERTFLFFDPPYMQGAYSPGFSKDHHRCLADWCDHLHTLGVQWLQSNAGDEVKDLYKNYIIEEDYIQRTCGGTVERNNIAKEYWIRNY